MDAQTAAPEGARRLDGARIATTVGVVWAIVVACAVGRFMLIGPVRRLPEMSGPVLPTDVVSPLVPRAAGQPRRTRGAAR